MQKPWVWSLSWEDPLEKEMATHSSIPAWKIPWTEEPGELQSMGLQKVRYDWATEHSSQAQRKGFYELWEEAKDNSEITLILPALDRQQNWASFP